MIGPFGGGPRSAKYQQDADAGGRGGFKFVEAVDSKRKILMLKL